MSIYGSVGSLAEMRGYVLDVKPNCGPDRADRFVNQSIRVVSRRKTWSDLLRFVQIPIPDAVDDGTVTVATGSSIVTGSATGWPVDDLIDTTCATAVRQPGMQKITPVAMRNSVSGVTITPGMWLLIDGGTASAEAVVVVEVTRTAFYASFTGTHSTSFTIQASSLAGRQFRTAYPFYTVTAVPSATTLWLDTPWADAGDNGLTYQILLVYCQPHPYIWRLKTAWDPVQGVALDVDNYSFDQIIAGDPQMTASENPTMMVPVPPNAGGVAQWMIYPPQASQRYIVAQCDTVWPRLLADEDRCPSFISPDVFIFKAQSLALRTKTVTQYSPRDPYYDPEQANVFEQMFADELESAEQADEARLAHRLQSWDKLAAGQFSANFMRSHAGAWPSDYNG